MIKPQFIAAAGVVVVIAAVGLNYAMLREESVPIPEPVSKSATPDSAPDSLREQPRPPSFDVVRINSKGDTVIAGRAAPGSTVRILDGEALIGKVIANRRGEWVFLPEKPLPPGSRKFRLEMILKSGTMVASKDSVILVVPEKNKDIAGQPVDGGSQALALKIPRNGPASVLQNPSPDASGMSLSVDAVDYTDKGKLSISGRATANSRIQLYLDNKFIGLAETGKTDTWALTPNTTVRPGRYKLRADQVNKAGKVLARVEFPFERANPINSMKPGTFVVIQPGNSLWRLARRTYGSGIRYTLIFKANADRIKNADLIYPGQIFTLPKVN